MKLRLEFIIKVLNICVHRNVGWKIVHVCNYCWILVLLKWFVENEVPLLKWPSESPDLNPIDHIWDKLDCRIRLQTLSKTGEQMKAFFTELCIFSKDTMSNLIESTCSQKALLQNISYCVSICGNKFCTQAFGPLLTNQLYTRNMHFNNRITTYFEVHLNDLSTHNNLLRFSQQIISIAVFFEETFLM